MSHVRTIHRVAGMTGREKMHFHLACSQVKGVEQQQLLPPYSMFTKVVQHVPRIKLDNLTTLQN